MEQPLNLFEQHDVDDTVIRIIANFMHPTQQTNLRETCRRMRATIPPPRRMTTIELIYDCAETGYCDLCIDLLQRPLPLQSADESGWFEFCDRDYQFSSPTNLMANRKLAHSKKCIKRYAIFFALIAHQWEIAEKIKNLSKKKREFLLEEIAASGDANFWQKTHDSLLAARRQSVFESNKMTGDIRDVPTGWSMIEDEDGGDRISDDEEAYIPYHAPFIPDTSQEIVHIPHIFLERSLRFAAFFGHTDLCNVIMSYAQHEYQRMSDLRTLLEYGTIGSQLSLVRAAYEKMGASSEIAAFIIYHVHTREMWEFARDCLLALQKQQSSTTQNPAALASFWGIEMTNYKVRTPRDILSCAFSDMIIKELRAIAMRTAPHEIQEIYDEWESLFKHLLPNSRTTFSTRVALINIATGKKQSSLTAKLYRAFIEEVKQNADSPINLALKWSEIDDIPICWHRIFAGGRLNEHQNPLFFVAIAQWIYTCPPVLANISKKSDGFAPDWTTSFADVFTYNSMGQSMMYAACIIIRSLHFSLFNKPPIDFDTLIERTQNPDLRMELEILKKVDSFSDVLLRTQDKIAHAKQLARETLSSCSLQ